MAMERVSVECVLSRLFKRYFLNTYDFKSENMCMYFNLHLSADRLMDLQAVKSLYNKYAFIRSYTCTIASTQKRNRPRFSRGLETKSGKHQRPVEENT